MKNILFAFLCLFAATSQAGVNIQHWTAPSGARVYFVASNALPMLDVQVDFAAGSMYAPAGKAGLAGLTVGLLETGAQLADSKLDEEQIAARLVDIGARLSSRVDHDRASVNLRTLASKPEQDAAIELLRAVVNAPTFPEDALKRERARHIAAIQEADTQPASIATKRFAEISYPNHPYGISASVESVTRIERDDLLAFWRDRFAARNAVISIIGDISRAEAEAIAVKLTEALPSASAVQPLPAVTLPQRQTLRVSHPASQSHIYIGMPALKRSDADYFPLLVGNYVLGGGGFVSRLMQEVREKRGYAYSVYSALSARQQEGPFEIGLQTKRAQGKEAIALVEKLLTDFLRDGPTGKELKAAKQNLVDGLALRIDSNAKILGYLATIGFYGLPLTYLDDFSHRVESVTAEQVREAFNRHVQSEHLVTVIVAAD